MITGLAQASSNIKMHGRRVTCQVGGTELGELIQVRKIDEWFAIAQIASGGAG